MPSPEAMESPRTTMDNGAMAGAVSSAVESDPPPQPATSDRCYGHATSCVTKDASTAPETSQLTEVILRQRHYRPNHNVRAQSGVALLRQQHHDHDEHRAGEKALRGLLAVPDAGLPHRKPFASDGDEAYEVKQPDGENADRGRQLRGHERA